MSRPGVAYDHRLLPHGKMRTSGLERGWRNLADAVTRAHGRAAHLGELVRVNAFVQRQRGSPLSYRYHPSLRAVRQAELNNSPDVDAAELRRITAEWHNSHGHYDEAAQLTVTSGDWSMASSLIVNNLGIARLLTWPYGFSLAKLFHHAPRARSMPHNQRGVRGARVGGVRHRRGRIVSIPGARGHSGARA